jgi:tyrosyl-tRNA synthetase
LGGALLCCGAMTAQMPSHEALLSDLERRGLLHQCTHREQLASHLTASRFVYAGFDPTRDSLTIGNLVSILLLKRFQLAGHRPVVVMGGGTGLIGDPSGKDSERQLMTRETIEEHIAGQRGIFEQLLDFEGEHAAIILNNGEWLEKLSYVEVLRDVGKHFSVNMMIQKDSVKSRLEGREHGISYTEFSYMILQAYDFSYLNESASVTLQLGGSDQWGNIVAGVDLTRRRWGREVYGLTSPLITKKDGGKFGKTEGGAIWLTKERTSPYSFYQFWINTSDEDVATFFKVFSLKPIAWIEEILREHEKNPGARAAQRLLAEELTELLHGSDALREATLASEALFSGQVTTLSEGLLDEVFGAAPSTTIGRERLLGRGIDVLDLMVETGAAKSKREARQFLSSGAVTVNGERVGEGFSLTEASLLHGKVALLRRGKKTWHLCRVSG